MVVDRVRPASKRVYIVIDGVDECHKEDQGVLLDIITWNNRNSNISWLVFSRFTPDISKFLLGPNMVIRPTDTMHDIRRYAKELVDHSPSLRSVAIRMEIVDTISRRAGGIFPWVRSMVWLLEKEEDVSNIRSMLQSLPVELKRIYDKIGRQLLCYLDAGQVDIVSMAFKWIACASRPLTFPELSEAIGFTSKTNTTDLEFTLGNIFNPFISISSSKVVTFTHRTVEEYLASDRCTTSLGVKYQAAHTNASKACLLYLSNSAFSVRLSSPRSPKIDMTLLSGQYPLLTYSALFWPEHVDFARAELHPELMRQLNDFISSKNLLTAIEVVLSVGGIRSLHRWMRAFLSLHKGLQKSSEYENIKRFIFDFQRLVHHYGYLLDESPSVIHSLIDERFPRKSHFWKHFGRPLISASNGQLEEWDTLISTLQQHRITCIATGTWLLAAADEVGVSIWDLRSDTLITQILDLPSLVVALAFSEDRLGVLCQDGTLKVASTRSWIIKWTLGTTLTLPAPVRDWSSERFWKEGYTQIDPMHVNLEFVGKGILAGNWLVNLENGTSQLVVNGSLSSSTTTQLICTKGLDLVTFTEDWKVATRKLGSPTSPLQPFKYMNESKEPKKSTTKRILAVSTTARFVAICRVTMINGHSRSETEFECLCRDLEMRFFTEHFGNGDQVTAAAFSDKESMLAVSSSNGKTFTNTMKVWTLSETPQVLWEVKQNKDYITTLAFGLEDTILIQAGQRLQVWDVSQWMGQRTIHKRMTTKLNRKTTAFPLSTRNLSSLKQSPHTVSTEIPNNEEKQTNNVSPIVVKVWKWFIRLFKSDIEG